MHNKNKYLGPCDSHAIVQLHAKLYVRVEDILESQTLLKCMAKIYMHERSTVVTWHLDSPPITNDSLTPCLTRSSSPSLTTLDIYIYISS